MTSERRKRAEKWLMEAESVSGVLAWDRPIPRHSAGKSRERLYFLTKERLALALGLPFDDVAVLIRAFRLDEDPEYAEQIHREHDTIALFRESAVSRLRQLIESPPPTLGEKGMEALERVRAQLGGGSR